MANVIDIHYDPTYWKDPERFDPNRFYDADKNVYVPNERLIPFLIGKRFCLGQSLAEKEFFLFFTGLMQKFEFLPKPNTDLPGIGSDAGVVLGAIRGAPYYEVVLKVRKDSDVTKL